MTIHTPHTPTDHFGRPLGSLRISVTDRCNIRCRYCMPEESYVWLPKASILSFEQTARLASVFAGLGVDKIRITGGEPLLRTDLPILIDELSEIPGIEDIAITTNGVLLERSVDDLKSAGLDRVTVSLDTLRPDRYEEFTRSKRLPDAVAGIKAAVAAGFRSVKVNTVVIRGFNDDELEDLLRAAADWGVELRFIEYMDVGGATQWSRNDVVPRGEILESVAARFGSVAEHPGRRGAAPAERFVLPSGQVFGVIGSTTAPFCSQCDRSRLTADGHWFLCLYADSGIDLKREIEAGASDDELRELIRTVWRERRDRGAEERLADPERGVLYQIQTLRSDPHREMHTRGG